MWIVCGAVAAPSAVPRHVSLSTCGYGNMHAMAKAFDLSLLLPPLLLLLLLLLL
jgi:hypothetical protein